MSDMDDRPEQPAHTSSTTTSTTSTQLPSEEERQWALFTHLSGLLGFVIPFGNIIGPLVIWQIKKDSMPFVDDQGKEVLNFQITVAIAVMACLLLMLIFIGLLLLPLVAVVALVLTVVGAVKANAGERYRYPFTLRLIS